MKRFEISTIFITVIVIGIAALWLFTSEPPPSPVGVRGAELADIPGTVDSVVDADEVVLIRNAEEFPSFVLICHDGNAYVSSRSRSSDGPQTPVIPDPQRQDECN